MNANIPMTKKRTDLTIDKKQITKIMDTAFKIPFIQEEIKILATR